MKNDEKLCKYRKSRRKEPAARKMRDIIQSVHKMILKILKMRTKKRSVRSSYFLHGTAKQTDRSAGIMLFDDSAGKMMHPFNSDLCYLS